MKKCSQNSGIRKATGVAKQRAKRFLNAVMPRKNKVDNSDAVTSELHFKNNNFSLTESEITFIQSQLEKGNKSFVKCFASKDHSLKCVSQAEVSISLDNAKELGDQSYNNDSKQSAKTKHVS